ncbi:hypothetical protein GCM10025786_06380 [Nocardioides caeni]
MDSVKIQGSRLMATQRTPNPADVVPVLPVVLPAVATRTLLSPLVTREPQPNPGPAEPIPGRGHLPRMRACTTGPGAAMLT